MNLADARDAVYLRTGYTTDDGLLTPERMTAILRTALNFISSEHDWDWLQATETLSTTSGTNYVTPLAGSAVGVTWIRTTHVTGPSGHSINRVPWSEFRLFPTASTGEPTIWSPRLERLYVWPVPDAVYALTHDFIRGPSALNQDSDTPAIPAQFHDAWVEYGAYLAFRRRGESDRAGEALSAYQEWMRVMADNRRRDAGVRRVAVRPGSWT